MKTLILYEFLKILRRRSTILVMAASLLLTAFLFFLPVLQYQIYQEDGPVRGGRGIALEKEQYARLSGPLTDEAIEEIIREYQRLFENPENVGYDGNEKFLIGGAWWDYVAPREGLLNLIAANYDMPGEYSGYSKLPDLDLENGADFYGMREKKIEALLDMPSRAMTEQQKDYWRGLSSRVDTPLPYGYYRGWETLISSFELFLFAMLSVCMVLAPVFSGEYQAGTDAVILAARYGKSKLIAAKGIAAFLFGLGAFSLHVAVAFGLTLTAFGADGWNLPLQIANTTIPYPYTFWQATVIHLGVMYLVLCALIAFTLLLSARMKSPYFVLIVVAPVLLIPVFLTPDGTSGFWNQFLFLTPYRSLMPEIGKYISYSFGGLILDAFGVRAVLYAALTAALVPLAGSGFRRHHR